MGDVTMLLDRATAGDRRAQEELYRRIEPELRKLARHWIRRKSARERVRTTDVIDRAFVKLMRLSPAWRHRGAFYVYAARNILGIIVDELGASSRRPDQLPDGHDLDDVPAPADGLSVHAMLTLRQALEDLERALSRTHRTVVELRFLAECTLDEVAEQLSIGRDKAFRMSKVALAYLRERLAP